MTMQVFGAADQLFATPEPTPRGD
ncbi:hypothetical protein O9929_01250 [Vibrio lentus]|nr:hypothetical protein [Vibrio lentus]